MVIFSTSSLLFFILKFLPKIKVTIKNIFILFTHQKQNEFINFIHFIFFHFCLIQLIKAIRNE